MDQVHGSALHGGQRATCCEAHTNFANESACLMADNVPNVTVIIHRSQAVLKMLSSLHVDILHNCFVKKTHVQQSFLHLQHTRHQLSLDDFSNCVAVLAPNFDTPVIF
jgi:hypothetical protein